MTQSYRSVQAIAWMRSDRCPECGERAADHSSARAFWLRDPLGCDLLPNGVQDRIDWQQELDALNGNIEAEVDL